MTYSEFINSFVAPIHTFFDCFTTLINSLIGNYIFITILGLSLFLFLFSVIKSVFLNFLSSNKNVDDIADKKKA